MPTLTHEQALLWVRDCGLEEKEGSGPYTPIGYATVIYLIFKFIKSTYLLLACLLLP